MYQRRGDHRSVGDTRCSRALTAHQYTDAHPDNDSDRNTYGDADEDVYLIPVGKSRPASDDRNYKLRAARLASGGLAE